MRGDFEAGAPYFAVFFIGSVAMAVGFGVHVALGGSPVTPDTYGPVVYEIPALMWVGVQVVCGLAAAVGFARRSRVLAALGAWAMVILIAFFGLAASVAPQGAVLMHSALWWAGPIAAWAAVTATVGRDER